MRRERSLLTSAVVLKKRASGERDYLVDFYSPDMGKSQALCKGGRAVTSRKNGHLEPLNLCTFQLYQTGQRFMLLQCQVENHFSELRSDFERSVMAMMMVEIVQKSTFGPEQSEAIFALLVRTLHKLDKSQGSFVTLEQFKLQLMDILGVLPDLNQCSMCQLPWEIEKDIRLYPQGHLSCDRCHGLSVNQGTLLPFSILKLVRYLQKTDLLQILRLTDEQKNHLSAFTQLFLQQYTGKEIVAEKIFDTKRFF